MVGSEDVLAPGTVLPGIVDVVMPGVDVEVLLLSIVVVVNGIVVGHVGAVVVVGQVGSEVVDPVGLTVVVVSAAVDVVDGCVVVVVSAAVDVVDGSVVVVVSAAVDVVDGCVVVVVSAAVDVVDGCVVVVSSRVVVVVQCTDVVGGDVVGTTVGTTSGTVVDVVEVDELVVVVEVVLVDELVVTADPRRATSTAGAFGGRGGSEDVGGEGAIVGAVDVVEPEVDVVIKTSEVGPTRSGIRPSFPSIAPANRETARPPMSSSTTPLDVAMIVDRSCHHAGAGRSYSGMSSVSNSHASASAPASSKWSNDLAAVGSGGGHIPTLFHLAAVPSGRTIRHRSRRVTEGLECFVAKLEYGSSVSRLRRGIRARGIG